MSKRCSLGLLAFAMFRAMTMAALAQSDDYVNGQVTRIDQSSGKITIRHGPIAKFGMDATMTMAFRVSDPAMLQSVGPGDRIRFVVDRIDGQFTVVKIEKAK
jgi:Cu/Ag efflux protein CusF